jgi:hypothetical protein
MSKVKFHTIHQPDSDTTCFILSCNRLDVLDKTIQSFLFTRDYETKMVLVDDSAEEGVFETLVERYGSYCDVICFPKNRSQWWAMDFMVSYCDTEYIFYLEDDWQLLKPGYLNQSKQILQKYRNIGTVDISWRTFEWQGIDSYDKTLVDDMFYYKKPWKISDYHLCWYGWIGSPNLKRRDDLILLGRVEKWHNEWNIDRRFLALGFKAVFLNDQYTTHLGDDCSRMEGKRPNDGTTPEDYYPQELQADRIWPKLDYLFLDKHWKHPNDVTMVTAMLDINRNDRNFDDHYLSGVEKVLQCRNPMVMYAEPKYHDWIREKRGTLPIVIKSLTIDDIKSYAYYDRIVDITQSEKFQTLADWIKGSALCNPLYIPLTLYKMEMLIAESISNPYGSTKLYWIDAGMCSSYGITEHIDTFNFNRLPDDGFFVTKYPYWTDSEIHGMDIDVMTKLCDTKPNFVCRATIFGGTVNTIKKYYESFHYWLAAALERDVIGTEESVFTLSAYSQVNNIKPVPMPNGDIKNFLNTIRSR